MSHKSDSRSAAPAARAIGDAPGEAATAAHSGLTYRHDIQGVRAIAVLLVVLYHAELPFLTGGYIGVDVFFVVSGFVITALLCTEFERTNRVRLLDFYARRIRRLLPAATLVLATTFIVFQAIYSPVERWKLAASGLATAVYLSNVWFALYATDYLGGDGSANPWLHTWSLSVEEQFYLFWPVLLWFSMRTLRKGEPNVGVWRGAMAISALSFAIAIVLTRVSQPWAFFSSVTRGWEFGAGAMLYLLHPRAALLSRKTRIALSALGLFIVMLSAFQFGPHSAMPGVLALAPVAGTCLMLFGSRPGDSGTTRLLGSKPLVALGNVSYGWYLWHWPILVAVRELYAQSTAALYAGIGLSLLLAFAMYRWFENPIRHLRYIVARPALSVAGGVLAILISASVLYSQRELAKLDALSPQQAAIKSAQEDMPRFPSGYDGCHATIPQTMVPEHCEFGDVDGNTTVVLFGDSHAQHWFPAFKKIASEEQWKLVTITKGGCPSVAIEPYLQRFRRAYTECTAWRQESLRRIIASRPTLVVLSNSYAYTTDGESRARWAAGLDEVLMQFDRANIRVLIVRDIPHPPFDAPTCLSRAIARRTDPRETCRFKPVSANNEAVFESERMIASRYHLARVVDLSASICGTEQCAVMEDGIIRYSDNNHMTSRFSTSLASALEPQVRQAMR
jgi:peptidoglycan/LPS O-acetylase OafA/YrhL